MLKIWHLAIVLLLLSICVSQVSAQSFSVDAISPTVTLTGGLPDDVYIPAGGIPPVLPAPLLGFSGSVLAGITSLEMDAMSYGRTLNEFGKSFPAFFSVDLGTSGVAVSAVAVEFNAATGSEASSDVFRSTYNSTNSLVFDGDGLATAPNPAAPPL